MTGRILTPDQKARFHDVQSRHIGSDAMAEGPQDWPTWSDMPRLLSPRNPLAGWRFWAVTVTPNGARIAPPWTLERAWLPGINRSTPASCRCHHGRHPMPFTPKDDCRCGIRLMQSLTALRAYARYWENQVGPMAAYAVCNAWGHIAPGVPDDDWQYTLRAEYVEIAGPLYVAPDNAQHADALAEHYGIMARAVEFR